MAAVAHSPVNREITKSSNHEMAQWRDGSIPFTRAAEPPADRVGVFAPAKDRPVLFSALAWAEVLLTLDRGDFGALLGGSFYDLLILTPGMFLKRERTAGRS